jgi:hypothetical protein
VKLVEPIVAEDTNDLKSNLDLSTSKQKINLQKADDSSSVMEFATPADESDLI